MRATRRAYLWGIALLGGFVLGYAFGMLSLALALHPDKNATPILILLLPGTLLGMFASRRFQSATPDITGKPPLAPAMLATAVGATAAIFTAQDIGNLGVITLMVWIVISLVPISIGVPVGIAIRFLYGTIRKKNSGDGNQPIGDGSDGESMPS